MCGSIISRGMTISLGPTRQRHPVLTVPDAGPFDHRNSNRGITRALLCRTRNPTLVDYVGLAIAANADRNACEEEESKNKVGAGPPHRRSLRGRVDRAHDLPGGGRVRRLDVWQLPSSLSRARTDHHASSLTSAKQRKIGGGEPMLLILQEVIFAVLFSVSAVEAADFLMKLLGAVGWL